MNPRLYALCRAGTDPAIDRALQESVDPLARMKRKLTVALEQAEWFDELQEKITSLEQSGEWEADDDAVEAIREGGWTDVDDA